MGKDDGGGGDYRPSIARVIRRGGGGGGGGGGESSGSREVYWHTTGRLVNTYTGQVLARVEGMETVKALDWWEEEPQEQRTKSRGNRWGRGGRAGKGDSDNQLAAEVPAGYPDRVVARGRIASRKVFAYFDLAPSVAAGCGRSCYRGSSSSSNGIGGGGGHYGGGAVLGSGGRANSVGLPRGDSNPRVIPGCVRDSIRQ